MSNIEKDFIKKLNEKPDNKINVKIPEHLLRMGSIKNKFKVVITDKLKVYTKNNSKENI